MTALRRHHFRAHGAPRALPCATCCCRPPPCRLPATHCSKQSVAARMPPFLPMPQPLPFRPSTCRSPALVLLHHYAWGASYGPGHGKGLYFFPPEQELTTFATVSGTGWLTTAWKREGGGYPSGCRLWSALIGVSVCSCVPRQRAPWCSLLVPRAAILLASCSNAALTTVCPQFYDIPVVSLRSAVWRNLAAGIEGFQVAGWG